MKPIRYPLILALALAGVLRLAAADFHEHLGLQLYSLREQIKTDLPGALDLVKGYGITAVEADGKPSLPIDDYAKLLKDRGLVAVGAHFGYEFLSKDLAGALHNAKVLGVKHATVPWIPHSNTAGLTAAEAHQAAADFNKWGEAFKAAGIAFSYHPHGYEFKPYPAEGGATGFDIIVRETKPKLVGFEMDVFWVLHAGQDPAALLQKMGRRWVLMHVKDMRKGAVTGLFTGHAAPIDNVAVGDGQIDWKAVLSAAQKAGVKEYFIEDETTTPLTCIPASLKYLRALKL
jgi:sugar phosphate isomerase/epimerase